MNLLLAAFAAPVDASNITDPLGGRFASLSNVFGFAFNVILGVGWVIGAIVLALGFIQYVNSAGDPKNVTKAQNWITYAIVGMALLLLVTAYRFIISRGLGAPEGWEINTITNFIQPNTP